MAENETYNVIWQVWQKEKQSTKLQQIPKTFYKDVFEYTEKLTFNTDSGGTVKENIGRLTNNIYERRKQKLLAYLAYNQQPPQPMPPEEEDFYTKLYAIVKGDKLSANHSAKSLIVVQNTPKIVLPSGNEIGPLIKDQVIAVGDAQDKEFLVANNLCTAE